MIMPCASRARVVLRLSISTGLRMARWSSTGTSFNRSPRRPPTATACFDQLVFAASVSVASAYHFDDTWHVIVVDQKRASENRAQKRRLVHIKIIAGEIGLRRRRSNRPGNSQAKGPR